MVESLGFDSGYFISLGIISSYWSYGQYSLLIFPIYAPFLTYNRYAGSIVNQRLATHFCHLFVFNFKCRNMIKNKIECRGALTNQDSG